MMREATEGDREGIAELVTVRIEALRRRGVYGVMPDPSALDLIGAHDKGCPMAWVLCEDDQVLGCAAVLGCTAGSGWSKAQRRQSAWTLSGLYTHPDLPDPSVSQWMTDWFRGHAARQGVRWLRGTVFSDRLQQRLVRLGWEPVASGRAHTYLLQYRTWPPLSASPAWLQVPPGEP
ncbi:MULTISPECIES: GNAT family N-acetyltransferase [Streptomyces]|uniref:hypothetical protein n=1 Tax=Streptomyces TaxID=1883 RepID=UPI0004CD89E5|nr:MULTISPECIES: hypothetical protein [Streptomyces]KOT52684.1 hypothetical protein ADK43_29915 [Streptomyces rimosus subsp. rimosus]